MLMMAPPPCRSMCGIAYLHIKNGPLRFTSCTRSQSSSVVDTGSPTFSMPTLLCRMSMRPKRSMVASMTARTSAARLTSPASANASPPAVRISSAVASAAARFRSTAAIRAPSRAKSSAVALPLPMPAAIVPAPVTRATFPCNRFGIRLLRVWFPLLFRSALEPYPAVMGSSQSLRTLRHRLPELRVVSEHDTCAAGLHIAQALQHAERRGAVDHDPRQMELLERLPQVAGVAA